MPSPRLKRRRSTWSERGRWLPLLLLVACVAPVERPEVGPAPRLRHDPFLVAPTIGYSVGLSVDDAQALETAYRNLMRGVRPESILAVAAELDHGATGPPAVVLAAQARFAQGRCDQALSRLAEVADLHPGYLAADLALGRCREEVGDLPGAAEAYSRASSESSAAAAKLADLAPRARDAAVARIRESLDGGLEEEARDGIASLQRWAPRDTDTLLAIRELAEDAGDRRLELQVARALTKEGGERELLARRAELELEVGDAGSGLRILEDLVARHPDDGALIQGLDRARFAWRISILPRPAQSLASNPVLNRAELATLFYWVFPSVRYGRPSEAIIANDIFDHEHRSEIVRVVNLGIMKIDTNLHAFKPNSGARRLDALRGMLRVLAQNSEAQRCLDGATVASEISLESTCSLAARCGLLDEASDCLPRAVLSGSSAMRMARNAARQLEVPCASTYPTC